MINSLRLRIREILSIFDPLQQEQTQQKNFVEMSDEEPTPCPICFEGFDKDTNIAIMDCGHKFHYKCMYKWNSTENGDTCPMCRTDLGLPDVVDTSDDEEEGIIHMPSEFENDLEELSEEQPQSSSPLDFSSDSDTEYESDIDDFEDDVLGDLREKRHELADFLENIGQNYQMTVCCKDCSKEILTCNFCSEPFCACKNTAAKPQFKANPFNKLYNSHNDKNLRDEEMIRMLKIDNPTGEDLLSPCVCSRCFANRDIVTKATIDSVTSDEGNNLAVTREVFEKTELLALYYNLYYDNSGQDNSMLYDRFPSYESLDKFRNYIVAKYNLAPIDASTPPSTPPPRPPPLQPPPLPPRNRNHLRTEYLAQHETSEDNANIRFIIQPVNTPRYNTSFTQYDNEEIFSRVILRNSPIERVSRDLRSSEFMSVRERVPTPPPYPVLERNPPNNTTSRVMQRWI